MSVEILTYGALGARLNISPVAARSLARRLRLAALAVGRWQGPGERRSRRNQAHATAAGRVASRTTSRSGRQWSRHCTWRSRSSKQASAGHRADFERERERADRLMAELLQATAEATAAREATARLEGEVAVLRTRARTG